MTGLTRIGLTMGDPAGIGPEIIVKTLAAPHSFSRRCIPVVIGDGRVLAETAAALGLSVAMHPIQDVADARGIAGTIDLIDLD
ncbi:MAG: hypothetical protein K8J31_29985, partial [Anaerolineae bacterium]|nr:hypothetical protein [Anaerolineae bacterium]